MPKVQGVHKVGEHIIQLGRTLIYTDALENIDIQSVPEGSLWVDIENGTVYIKLKGGNTFTKLPIAKYETDEDFMNLLESFVKKYEDANIENEDLRNDVDNQENTLQELSGKVEHIKEQIHDFNIYKLYEDVINKFVLLRNEIKDLEKNKLDKTDMAGYTQKGDMNSYLKKSDIAPLITKIDGFEKLDARKLSAEAKIEAGETKTCKFDVDVNYRLAQTFVKKPGETSWFDGCHIIKMIKNGKEITMTNTSEQDLDCILLLI